MDNPPDESSKDNPRLFRPLRAFLLTVGMGVAAFACRFFSFSTDAVTLSSRLAVLLLPVTLGLIPVPLVGAFVRRRSWSPGRVLRVCLALYVGFLLFLGNRLLSQGFGIMGPPVAPPAAVVPAPAGS